MSQEGRLMIKWRRRFSPTWWRMAFTLWKYRRYMRQPVLNAGAGDGNFEWIINPAMSIDIDPRKSYISKRDLTKTNFFPELFNTVVCLDVLEHIERDDLAIKEIHRILIDGGFLIVTLPVNMKLWSRIDDIAGHCRRYDDLKIFKPYFHIEHVEKWRLSNNAIRRMFKDGFPVRGVFMVMRK